MPGLQHNGQAPPPKPSSSVPRKTLASRLGAYLRALAAAATSGLYQEIEVRAWSGVADWADCRHLPPSCTKMQGQLPASDCGRSWSHMSCMFYLLDWSFKPRWGRTMQVPLAFEGLLESQVCHLRHRDRKSRLSEVFFDHRYICRN